jgi:DNA processing protein
LIDSEIKERLADTIALLNIPGIGRGRSNRLINELGSPSAVLAAPVSQLEAVPGLSHATASAIKEHYDGDRARQIAARIVQLGWAVLFPNDSGYPAMLSEIAVPPPLLFRLGSAATPDDRLIAVVGTRHATEAGRLFTHKLADDLARAGITVVSGMAEGIDSAAHRGALDARGNTVAVWGTPLDRVYPASNRKLAERIKQNGAIYSEYLPGVEANPINFPERNRIISGLSEGVVVVEAGRKSGALITAQYALEQGRELFAVPGPPHAEKSIGTNDLVKMGAKLLTGIDDIFDELPRLKGGVSAKKFKQSPDLTDMERRLVDLLSEGPLQIDQLCRDVSLPVAETLEFLLALELKGIVRELSGKRFVLTE